MEDCCGDAGGPKREKSDAALMISSERSTAPLAPATARVAAPHDGDACCSGSSSDPSNDTVSHEPHPGPAGGAHLTGDDCCSAKEQEIAALSAHLGVKRVLQVVLAINLAMFVAEFTAGMLANSTALMADSVDMLGDALVYILSLYALQRSLRWRAGAAVAKGGIIAAFGIWVMIEAALKLVNGGTPAAGTMVLFGLIALVANLSCLALLYRFRHRDVNLSSTFECSRNDVIANTGVLLAAGGVYATGAAWPDILVGAVIAVLFFRSAIRVLRQAWPQFRSGSPAVAVALD
ncbi:cation transporter [Blastomonas sp.]|uniref:cation transporter n=1 Tax=Alphaproteobacteria TaxID=28211 RepID=UPI002602FE88|nr:cation diffusion facilitator family transporter [Blastomonas sp.]MDM7957980.1 cation diffusion facilitator family transporter [Blastomonas sp.]